MHEQQHDAEHMQQSDAMPYTFFPFFPLLIWNIYINIYVYVDSERIRHLDKQMMVFC